jgi:membrane protease YdiL (CAAX protease family)
MTAGSPTPKARWQKPARFVQGCFRIVRESAPPQPPLRPRSDPSRWLREYFCAWMTTATGAAAIFKQPPFHMAPNYREFLLRFDQTSQWMQFFGSRISLAGGLWEKLVFRGYLQCQLWAIGGSLILAIALQAIIFSCGPRIVPLPVDLGPDSICSFQAATLRNSL